MGAVQKAGGTWEHLQRHLWADLKPTQQGEEKQPVHPEPQPPPVSRANSAPGSPCPPTQPTLVQPVPQVQVGAWRDRLMVKPFLRNVGLYGGAPRRLPLHVAGPPPL